MIYVEGKPDRVLVSILTSYSLKEVSVEGDKGRVFKRLQQTANCLALVDQDLNASQPTQLGLMVKNEEASQLGLLTYFDGGKSNRVIVLCPKLEDWIIRASQIANLEIGKPPYNLANTPKSLHKEINGKLDKLDLLVNDLLDAQSPRILKLQELLTR